MLGVSEQFQQQIGILASVIFVVVIRDNRPMREPNRWNDFK